MIYGCVLLNYASSNLSSTSRSLEAFTSNAASRPSALGSTLSLDPTRLLRTKSPANSTVSLLSLPPSLCIPQPRTATPPAWCLPLPHPPSRSAQAPTPSQASLSICPPSGISPCSTSNFKRPIDKSSGCILTGLAPLKAIGMLIRGCRLR